MPTLEQYQEMFNNVMLNPDNAPAIMATALDGVKEDLATINTQRELLTQHEAKIADLRDTNQKLFLRTTGQDSGQENKEQQPPNPDDEINSWLNTEYGIGGDNE